MFGRLRDVAPSRSLFGEPALAGSIAGAVGLLLLVFVPPSGDASAHFYRAFLAREGVWVLDNLWYQGFYPFASYSLLYYAPAAVLGNRPLVLAASIASAVLFASFARAAWGSAARWPSRAFAAISSAPLLLGQYPFAAGIAVLLGTLRALQRGRFGLALGLAALTLAFSPLAFLFLCLVLAAAFVARPSLGARRAVAIALAALAGLEVALLVRFRLPQTYVYSPVELAPVLATSALGGTLALRARRRELAAFFGLWLLANLAALLLPNPVGHNLARLRWYALPLLLLAAFTAGFRPRWLATAAVSFGLAATAVPSYERVRSARGARSDDASFWQPALTFLAAHSSPAYRVEVVPTGAHWESYYVPRAGFALARGWLRQVDLAENRLLYERPLWPRPYEAWLRSRGVRYVLMAQVALEEEGAEAEADLLRSGHSGLVEVARPRGWRIYELPAATPILTGGPSRITRFGHERIAGWTARPGSYRLRVRYSRYWKVASGRLCLAPAGDGSMLLRVVRPGRFVLAVEESAAGLLNAVVGRKPRCRRWESNPHGVSPTGF